MNLPKIEMLAASLIRIPASRHRQEVTEEHLQSLAESIAEHGLIHPPVVRPDSATPGQFLLIVGVRRFMAMQRLHGEGREFRVAGDRVVPPNTVPAILFPETPDEVAEHLELEENIRRVNLTWREEAVAVAALHKLHRNQDRSWTFTDTAEELQQLGNPVGKGHAVHNKILLAEHMTEPRIRDATSERQALQRLTRSLEEVLLGALSKTETSKRLRERLDIHVADALRWLPQCAAERYDVIITDPPYGIGASDGWGTVTKHHYADSPAGTAQLLERSLPLLTRVAKAQAHLYLFFDLRQYELVTNVVAQAGWRVVPHPIVWAKGQGIRPDGKRYPYRTYETILFAVKGDRLITNPGPDVVNVPPVFSRSRVFGADKPPELYKILLERSVTPGNRALDPFCGTGPVLVAAAQLGCRATAVDQNPEVIELAVESYAGWKKAHPEVLDA